MQQLTFALTTQSFGIQHLAFIHIISHINKKPLMYDFMKSINMQKNVIYRVRGILPRNPKEASPKVNIRL